MNNSIDYLINLISDDQMLISQIEQIIADADKRYIDTGEALNKIKVLIQKSRKRYSNINPEWEDSLPKSITYDNIPDACKGCSNHPSNGGSGICHCTLGLPEIT